VVWLGGNIGAGMGSLDVNAGVDRCDIGTGDGRNDTNGIFVEQERVLMKVGMVAYLVQLMDWN
jgi:hypothetical protein